MSIPISSRNQPQDVATITLSMRMVGSWARRTLVRGEQPKWTLGGVTCSGTAVIASVCAMSKDMDPIGISA